MNTAERFTRQHLSNPDNLRAHVAQRFGGMDPATFENHIRVMNQVRSGSLSSKAKAWLHDMGKKAGWTQAQVDAQIRQVLAIPDAQARMRAYVGATDADTRVADEVVQIADRYSREADLSRIESRLERNDQALRKSGTQFEFEDRPEFQADRREATQGVRASIEKAMVSSGLMAPKPQTLQEAQARAQSYASAVANRLERRQHQDGSADLRSTIEDQWLAADAMGAKADVGLDSRTIGDIAEEAQAEQTFAESLTP